MNVTELLTALERIADPRNTHFAGDAQVVAREALAAYAGPVAQASQEAVATLHDDGCFTWKRDEFRLKYDRQRAGWRMDVFAAPARAAMVPATQDVHDAMLSTLGAASMYLTQEQMCPFVEWLRASGIGGIAPADGREAGGSDGL